MPLRRWIAAALVALPVCSRAQSDEASKARGSALWDGAASVQTRAEPVRAGRIEWPREKTFSSKFAIAMKECAGEPTPFDPDKSVFRSRGAAECEEFALWAREIRERGGDELAVLRQHAPELSPERRKMLRLLRGVVPSLGEDNVLFVRPRDSYVFRELLDAGLEDTVQGVALEVRTGAGTRGLVAVEADLPRFLQWAVAMHEGLHLLQRPLQETCEALYRALVRASGPEYKWEPGQVRVFAGVLSEGYTQWRTLQALNELLRRPSSPAGADEELRAALLQALPEGQGRTAEELLQDLSSGGPELLSERAVTLHAGGGVYRRQTAFLRALVRSLGPEPARRLLENGDAAALRAAAGDRRLVWMARMLEHAFLYGRARQGSDGRPFELLLELVGAETRARQEALGESFVDLALEELIPPVPRSSPRWESRRSDWEKWRNEYIFDPDRARRELNPANYR